MAFWGLSLKAGAKQKVDLPDNEVLHFSQVCLHDPKDGKNYLQVQVDGTTYTLACLEKDKSEHCSLDLFFGPQAPVFVNKGKSEIHMSGYFEPKGEGEDSEEEEEEVLGKSVAKKSEVAKKDEAKKTEVAKKAEPAKKEAAKPDAKKPAAKKPEVEEDEDMEEGEEEDEMEESEEEEASAEEAPASKRKAEEAKQPPAKKAKAESAKPEAKGKAVEKPKTDGKKTEEKPKTDGKKTEEKSKAEVKKTDVKPEVSEYVKELVAHLTKHGKTKLGTLGSVVKRPSGVPKMKVIFEQHKDKFSLNGDEVSLKN